MKKPIRAKLAIAILIVFALCTFIWWHTKPANIEGRGSGGRNQIYVVKVIHAQRKDMPVMIQEVGNVEAEESVSIIPQITGTLKKIHIEQGQTVKAGQLLFEIDSSVYAANVAQAKANLERDQAQLAFLKATADRYQALAKLEYVTRQQYDESVASVKSQEALVAADNAQLQQQKIQFSYTQIRAPISGKAGAINVHVGDLMTAGSATPLLVINRLDNVLVTFNIPQDRLHDLLTYQRAGTLKVAVLSENGAVLGQGELAFISNVVSGQTGTVQVKAKVANSDLALWPGQLVRVRLILTVQPQALVIPSNSVQLGQKGNYVYVVKNNKAAIQPITVSREVGNQSVVTDGLQPEDAVIAEIPPGLTDGSAVQMEGLVVAPEKTGKQKQR